MYDDIDPAAVLRDVINDEKRREYMRAVTGPALAVLDGFGLDENGKRRGSGRVLARPSVAAALVGFRGAE